MYLGLPNLSLVGKRFPGEGGVPPGPTNSILLEIGDDLLLESGDPILLES